MEFPPLYIQVTINRPGESEFFNISALDLKNKTVKEVLAAIEAKIDYIASQQVVGSSADPSAT